SPALAQLRSGRFFVDVANLWERCVASVLTSIPLKLIGQSEIAPSYVLPLGPSLRVAFSVRFHAKHCGHSSAFDCRSHDFLNQHPYPRRKPSNRTIGSFTSDHSSFGTELGRKTISALAISGHMRRKKAMSAKGQKRTHAAQKKTDLSSLKCFFRKA